jgi:hypothetical protein
MSATLCTIRKSLHNPLEADDQAEKSGVAGVASITMMP